MTLFTSLQSAARLVVLQDHFCLEGMNLARWAETYRCSIDEVEEALKIALNGSRKLPEEQAASTPFIPNVQEVDDE